MAIDNGFVRMNIEYIEIISMIAIAIAIESTPKIDKHSIELNGYFQWRKQ